MKTSFENPMLGELIALCLQEGILDSNNEMGFEKRDLIDEGLIDSMGLLSLQSLIEDAYGLLIPQELFVMELRTLESIAGHLVSAQVTPKNKVDR